MNGFYTALSGSNDGECVCFYCDESSTLKTFLIMVPFQDLTTPSVSTWMKRLPLDRTRKLW